jgi:hypothetical protein
MKLLITTLLVFTSAAHADRNAHNAEARREKPVHQGIQERREHLNQVADTVEKATILTDELLERSSANPRRLSRAEAQSTGVQSNYALEFLNQYTVDLDSCFVKAGPHLDPQSPARKERPPIPFKGNWPIEDREKATPEDLTVEEMQLALESSTYATRRKAQLYIAAHLASLKEKLKLLRTQATGQEVKGAVESLYEPLAQLDTLNQCIAIAENRYVRSIMKEIIPTMPEKVCNGGQQ